MLMLYPQLHRCPSPPTSAGSASHTAVISEEPPPCAAVSTLTCTRGEAVNAKHFVLGAFVGGVVRRLSTPRVGLHCARRTASHRRN